MATVYRAFFRRVHRYLEGDAGFEAFAVPGSISFRFRAAASTGTICPILNGGVRGSTAISAGAAGINSTEGRPNYSSSRGENRDRKTFRGINGPINGGSKITFCGIGVRESAFSSARLFPKRTIIVYGSVLCAVFTASGTSDDLVFIQNLLAVRVVSAKAPIARIAQAFMVFRVPPTI